MRTLLSVLVLLFAGCEAVDPGEQPVLFEAAFVSPTEETLYSVTEVERYSNYSAFRVVDSGRGPMGPCVAIQLGALAQVALDRGFENFIILDIDEDPVGAAWQAGMRPIRYVLWVGYSHASGWDAIGDFPARVVSLQAEDFFGLLRAKDTLESVQTRLAAMKTAGRLRWPPSRPLQEDRPPAGS